MHNPGNVDGAQSARPFWAWAMVDFANSAFSALVITFVFSVYFKDQVVSDPHIGSILWGVAIGLSGILVVVLAPCLGMLLDQDRGRMTLALRALTAFACLATLVLACAQPQASILALIGVLAALVVANAAFELGGVIINATLRDVAAPHEAGWKSGVAWGLGYAGGIIALAGVLVVFIGAGGMAPLIPLDKVTGEPVRAAMILVAVWFAVFSLPFLMCIGRLQPGPKTAGASGLSVRALGQAVRAVISNPPLLRFFLGSALVRDGLTTLFAVGALYASTVVGLTPAQIIVFGIGMNITAAIGAVGFGFLDHRLGSRRIVFIALGALIILSVLLLGVRDPILFIGIALCLGVFVGPAQASLRVWLNALSPADRSCSHFGFYALSGRAVSVVGPLLYAGVLAVTGSPVAALATIPAVWILAWPLLHWADDPATCDSSRPLAKLE